ncbi:MAG: MBOAT family O-acyltransferase [Bacteriovoracaceae bacterium]|jgi:D-alanyl-lipoteichoic acid acyltransferase DltB (MBOAT superfamily)|nr:membrane-bound O-acyltransferase family protein [Halobacteriovoraceae bacterium]MDP7321762.1 MBOAT family O-acyltransferase [Bacteriovoracaceae bacterium]|tara:strand:- start:30 stop:1487 length:1458 start_codon:yes stop_codon:yes gene_type:complete
MLFNSYIFIFIFLPITFVIHYLIGKHEKHGHTLSHSWLILASLFFYGYWNFSYLSIIISSIIINFLITHYLISKPHAKIKKPLFLLGLSFNLGLLGYFKYKNFFMENMNLLLNSDFHFTHVLLPLGISFFTLQQIAYLVDVYEGLVKKTPFHKYALFVCFFPQLIAGPIVHYKEVMPQFDDDKNHRFNIKNINLGIFVFILGLAKKVLLADTFAIWANAGFNHTDTFHFFQAWGTSLSYTMQLYFDFSGYSDMAIGLGLLFNIKLPKNFDSPFLARNIIDFWTKWHITLSQFITTYIFTPLLKAMPKFTFTNSMISIFITMCIAGLWHGAAWTFVLYGALHGVIIIINHIMKKRKIKLPKFWAIFITFQFINIVFTIFRAEKLETAFNIFKGMFGLTYFKIPKGLISEELILKSGAIIGPHMNNDQNLNLIFIIVSLYIVFKLKNSMQLMQEFKPQTKTALFMSFIFVLCLFGLNRVSDFIYFNF